MGSRGMPSDGALPDVNKPNFYSSQRPKSGGDDGLMSQILNMKGKFQCFSLIRFNLAPQKGKLFKGTPFAYLKTSVEDKSRI